MLKTPILNNQLKILKYNNSFWTTARMNIKNEHVSMETILDTDIVLLLVLYIMVQQ